MWKSSSPLKEGSLNGGRSSSMMSLRRDSFLHKAVSLQFLNRGSRQKDKEEKAKIKLRYMDTSKYIIWPFCRFTPEMASKMPVNKYAPLAEGVDRLSQKFLPPDLEDHRSPYPPCAINTVLRSDSEDSEDDIDRMTRL